MGTPNEPPPGTIILLNGVSSSGKTSLARALLDVFDGPYCHVSIDAFEGMARRRLALAGAQDFSAGCLVPVMHGTAATFAGAGVGVVVDTVLTAAGLDDAARRFASYRVLFVGVHCSPAELRRREQARGDRGAGRAAAQLPLVHPLVQARGGYDLEVDTTAASPAACALRIKLHLETGPASEALRRLRPGPGPVRPGARAIPDLTDARTLRRRGPLLAAHRGAVGPGAPENTLAAVEAAAGAGFDLVEVDVEATRDGVPVLFHPDPAGSLRVACGVDAAVGDLTAAGLRALRHRASDQPLPTLDEALARCAVLGLGVVLDLKAGARRPTVLAAVAAGLERHALTRAALLLSEDEGARAAMAGRAVLMASREERDRAVAGEAVALAGRFWPDFSDRLPEEEVALLRRCGALVLATVDRRRYPRHAHRALAAADIARLRAAGVDLFLTGAGYRDLFDDPLGASRPWPPPGTARAAQAARAAGDEERAMTLSGALALDHVAIPTARPEAMMTFYRDLGFEVPDERLWRGVPDPRLSIVCGDQKVNLHAPEEWRDPGFTLRAPAARPGCGDLCFVWQGGLAVLFERLRRAGAAVEAGPVGRAGGRDHGRAAGTSVYTRDPDGNLLEFISYDAAADDRAEPAEEAEAPEATNTAADLAGFTVPLAVTVRACRRDDLRDLEWFGLFEAHRAWFDETFRRQGRGEVQLLVAEANRFPVGQVLVDFTAGAGEPVGVLSALRVLPCLQNLGIGARLVGAAERLLRERGLAVSEIGACTDNPGARRLYERLGYHLVGEQQEPYASPRPDGSVDRGTFTEWVFRKPLQPVRDVT